MNDLFRAMAFNDDVLPVFDAFSEWCKQRRISPESFEGSRAACRLVDLMQSGLKTKEALLAAMEQQRAA